MASNLRIALGCRLRFRAQFLKVVEMADARTPTNIKDLWTDLLAALPDIKSSTHLGKAVPASFSTKIQRKLASTVPPRPIVQVSQDAAFEHLERLCRDASVVVEVLKYYESHSLMVCVPFYIFSQLTKTSDVCDLVSDSKAPAVSLCPHLIATLLVLRHGNPRHHVHSASTG
jgi:hypothetical protein